MISKSRKCIHCGENGDLCVSHSIPDAFFRGIKKSNNGKTLSLTRGDSDPVIINDRGGAYLMCARCECQFNKRFDQYFVKIVRLIRNKYEAEETPIVHVDGERFIRAFLSIIWRASHSDEDMYNHLSELKLANLSSALFSDDIELIDNFSMTAVIIAGISETDVLSSKRQSMRQIILAPMISPKISISPKGLGQPYRIISMIVEGVYLALIAPKLGYPKNRRPGLLRKGHKKLKPSVRALLDLPFASNAVLEIVESAVRSANP